VADIADAGSRRRVDRHPDRETDGGIAGRPRPRRRR
jgi:hypothetical protein